MCFCFFLILFVCLLLTALNTLKLQVNSHSRYGSFIAIYNTALSLLRVTVNIKVSSANVMQVKTWGCGTVKKQESVTHCGLVVKLLLLVILNDMCCLKDQFDTLELSDNEIRKLDGFPLLRRLKCVVLNNNRISSVVVVHCTLATHTRTHWVLG